MANTYIQLEIFTESKGMLTYYSKRKKTHKNVPLPLKQMA